MHPAVGAVLNEVKNHSPQLRIILPAAAALVWTIKRITGHHEPDTLLEDEGSEEEILGSIVALTLASGRYVDANDTVSSKKRMKRKNNNGEKTTHRLTVDAFVLTRLQEVCGASTTLQGPCCQGGGPLGHHDPDHRAALLEGYFPER